MYYLNKNKTCTYICTNVEIDSESVNLKALEFNTKYIFLPSYITDPVLSNL